MLKRTEFTQAVNQGEIANAYLFLGEEDLFHQDFLSLLRQKLLVAEEEEYAYLKLNASQIEGDELINQLQTPAFFSEKRLIHLTALASAAKGIDEVLLKGLPGMADEVYLIVSATKLDGRKKVHQELQKKLTVVDCKPLTAAEIPGWVKSYGQTIGLRLTPLQLSIFAQRVGTDLSRAKNELGKLKLFAGAKTTLSDAELEQLLPGEPEPNIFKLMDALARKEARQSIPQLQELLNAGENELKILATLARQFRNILAALVAKEQGLSAKALAGKLGINPFVAEKSFTQARFFSKKELAGILERLLLADLRMKTGQKELRLELELVVVEICAGIKA